MNYGKPDVHFDENRLPPGQNPIITNSMEKFQFFVELLMRSKQKTGYTTMGVVTGLAGVGKTIAIQTFLDSLEERSHTGLPAGIVIKVTPGSTTRAFLENLLKGFGERPRGLHTNRYKIADEAAEAILNYDLKILFVDESDLLNVDGFEFLRYIFNKTGCPIVVVGLRQILRVIGEYEKFESRVGPHMPFQPPEQDEVLSTILPQLIIPHWKFNASSEADLVMGMELWNLTKPSFRNLRKVLQYASILADIQEKERISRAILKLSYQMMIGQKAPEELMVTEEAEEEGQTEFERESERRQDAREKKNEEEEEA
jgi:DNA transposition AAA+ family ATPase